MLTVTVMITSPSRDRSRPWRYSLSITVTGITLGQKGVRNMERKATRTSSPTEVRAIQKNCGSIATTREKGGTLFHVTLF